MALSYQAAVKSMSAFGCVRCKALAIGYERPEPLNLLSILRLIEGHSAVIEISVHRTRMFG
jgi:hypothetical protein